ncbi:MAG: polyphenol oxidase family protein, partial [Acidimicrobiales bacterium]|nr:polyphenol oxidase family protein [Acidimicrobiales bacterium]
MARTLSRPLHGGTGIEITISDRNDGSLRVTEPDFAQRLALFWGDPVPLTWLRQVHGEEIVIVTAPGARSGSEADGAFTELPNAPLAVTVADCAPVVIAAAGSSSQALAVVHAGWRGLMAGIIEKAAVMVVAAAPDGERFTFCGPCIGADDYQFSATDLVPIAERYGPTVVSRTRHGGPALDLFAGVSCALSRSGFP